MGSESHGESAEYRCVVLIHSQKNTSRITHACRGAGSLLNEANHTRLIQASVKFAESANSNGFFDEFHDLMMHHRDHKEHKKGRLMIL